MDQKYTDQERTGKFRDEFTVDEFIQKDLDFTLKSVN